MLRYGSSQILDVFVFFSFVLLLLFSTGLLPFDIVKLLLHLWCDCDEGFRDGLKLFVLEGDGVLLKVNKDVKWLQLLVKKDD